MRLKLWYDDKTASVRRSDPETSVAASASISRDVLNASQRVVLNTFQLERRPLTDEELIAAVRRHFPRPLLADSSCRTRRRELQRRGLIILAGHGVTRAGRRCMKFVIPSR